MFSAAEVSSRCPPCWSGSAQRLGLVDHARTYDRSGPAIGPTALLGSGQRYDLRAHSRSGHRLVLRERIADLRAEFPRHPGQQLGLRGDVSLHARAAGLGIADRGLPGEISFLSPSARRAFLAAALDLGDGLRLPVLRPGVLLPRFHGPWAAAAVRHLCDFRDDRALLHDPFRQADGRDLWRDRGGDRSGAHEPEDTFDLVRGVPARGRGDDDGFLVAVAQGDAGMIDMVRRWV